MNAQAPASRTRLTLLASLIALVAAPGFATAAGPFSVETVTDADTQWPIVVLRHADGKRPENDRQARIAPQAGGNLFSLEVAGEELLVQPEKLADLQNHRAGTPILFPTPNRVRDASMTFEGRVFTFEANNQKNFIHGLARKRPWQVGATKASSAAAEASVFLEWDTQQPEFARFPIRHRLTVTYTLRRDGLRIAYAVENKDEVRLPFGFGLHPWFRVPGDKKDVFVQVPVAQRMEAEDKLPTGKLIAVAGTPFDLRSARAVADLNLDDVYFGTTPARAPAFELRDKRLRVTLAGSREFTHAVVFTPPDRPVFCVENQTSSTDAHNLWTRGLKQESHLLVVEKGKTARGYVDWKIARLK